ncbi:MAG: amidohydrolase [Kiritimatiellae bacterium]|nr:amidohydrolase [Kiritimatiellia bacterium]
MKIIDAHSHIGNFGSWARFDFDIPRLREQMAEFDIEKTLLTGANCHDNDSVLAAFREAPDLVVPVAWVTPTDPGVMAEIRRRVTQEGFRAVKLHPLFDAYSADDDFVDPVIDLAGELGVPVFVHSGHPPYSLPWQIALLAERHPAVPIVLLHMGHAHGVYVDAALKMARRHPNLYLETSGTSMSIKIREAYDTVGNDRVLFGIDSPFHEPSVEIEKTRATHLPDAALRRIYHDNAAKLLGL